MGVNAHIDLDLAIAAAATSPGRDIYSLRRDYDRINDILIQVLDGVQGAMNSVSPSMGLLDDVAGGTDEQLLGFSVRTARAGAWQNAVILANSSARDQAFLEYLLDAQATALGTIIGHPSGVLNDVVRAIHRDEVQDVATVIDHLDHALDTPSL
jgi:hypothetical protein